MKRVSVFFIAAALVAVMAGCSFNGDGGDNGDNGDSYTLTIISTAGGSVTTPGEGYFTHDVGTVVNLTAEAEDGCEFANWTGSVDTIANVTAASTAVTMNSHCSIRANFSGNTSCPVGINYTETEAEQLIIDLINDERQEQEPSLATLSEDALLTGLAWEHSISMVENDFFGHERYPGDRDLTYEQPYGTARGENVAKIPTRLVTPGPYLSLQEVCEWAVSGWMESPGHRANIVN
ncbi:MAG: CAP domain-containing protein, partial [Chloroflexota bacterium]